MAKIAPIINNFSSGELAPRMRGRVDVEQYKDGAETLENMLVSHYGTASRRPGTYYVSTTKTNQKARLIPFEFNTEQAYVLEFTALLMRVYKDDGIVVTAPNTPYELVTTYAEADLFDLQFAQDADTMYITHKSYPPRKITRTGHTAWTITTVDFQRGPFLALNTDQADTLTASADTGAGITVTAIGHTPFTVTSSIGSIWKLDDGYFEITATASTTVVTATVRAEPDGTAGDLNNSAAPSADWAEGAFSIPNGYPRCVAFYEQRLMFAGSTSYPQHIWGSVSQEYENMHTDTTGSGPVDIDAIIYVIASAQVNEIRYLDPGIELIVGTPGGIFALSSGSDANAMTYANVVVRRKSTFGTALIMSERIGNAVYYIQRNLRTLREFVYSLEDDSYVSNDMTDLSDHITESGITDMEYQQSPENLLWCVRTDGELATFTRQTRHKVSAWSRQILGGSFGTDGQAIVESVAVIPDGEEDQVWISVKRTVDDSTVRYVEYFKTIDWGTDDDDMFFVDSGLTYDSTAATTITGLTHLVGETVSVLTDGAVHPDVVVDANGEIDLEWSAKVVQAGLSYTSTYKSVNLEAGAVAGTSQGKMKRIYKVLLRLYKTLGVKIGHSDAQDTIPFRDVGDEMDAGPDVFSGDKLVKFNRGWDRDAYIKVIQDQPLPLTVIALVPFMTTSDGG